MNTNLRKIGLGILLMLVLLLPVSARADFGNFSGDSDYDFSWDNDSDYSWDNDSSWDSDNDYWISDSSYVGDMDGGAFAMGMAIFLVVVYFMIKKTRRAVPVRPRTVSAVLPNLMPIEAYTRIDPLFSRADLCEKLANLYVQMQQAWQAKNIEAMRPYFTDALYSQMDRQLGAFRKQGFTNYIERIAVLGVELQGYYQSGQEDHIVALVHTRIVDYTLEDKTGRLVSGDRLQERFMTYEWELVRPSGTMTTKNPTITNVSCPNCGAPLSINQSAKCEYCGSVVTLSKHDWVIFAIKGITQATR